MIVQILFKTMQLPMCVDVCWLHALFLQDSHLFGLFHVLVLAVQSCFYLSGEFFGFTTHFIKKYTYSYDIPPVNSHGNSLILPMFDRLPCVIFQGSVSEVVTRRHQRHATWRCERVATCWRCEVWRCFVEGNMSIGSEYICEYTRDY